MNRVFVDPSAWHALVDANDPDHSRVTEPLLRFENRLLTSDYVFDETATLLRYRCGHAPALRFGQAALDGSLAELAVVSAADRETAWEVFRDFDDQSLSFTDCTSFALMRRLRSDTAISLDKDFEVQGFRRLPDGAAGS